MNENEEVLEDQNLEVEDQEVEETPNGEGAAEGSEAPDSEVVEEDEDGEDDELDLDWTQYMPALPEVEAPELDPQTGGVDPQAYTQWMMAQTAKQVQDQIRFAQSETRLWKEVEKAYPQVRKNPKQREILHKLRIADVSTGGRGDLKAIAGEFYGQFEEARNEGRNAERTSVKVQKSASLASPTGSGVDTSETNIMERMGSRDPRVASEARREALKAMMKSGKV